MSLSPLEPLWRDANKKALPVCLADPQQAPVGLFVVTSKGQPCLALQWLWLDLNRLWNELADWAVSTTEAAGVLVHA